MTSITGKVPGPIENPRPVHGEPPSIWNFLTVINQMEKPYDYNYVRNFDYD